MTPGLSPAAKRVLLGGGALVFVLLLTGWYTGWQGADKAVMGDPSLAQAVCVRALKSELTSPATAQFRTASRSDLGNGRFRVSGSVDAENSFGALLRQSYDCTVWFESADTYRIETLELHQ
jgi:hypothetical protein